MDIEGKVVAVTGAASGIGRALARAFHAAGAKGVAVCDLNGGGVMTVAEEIAGYGQQVDVSDEAQINDFVEKAEAAFGPIDIFCSNAGIPSTKTEEPSNADWQRNWDIHVMGHVYAARAVADKMAERGSGYLVQTASAAGLLCTVTSAPYTVSKHAAVGYAEWLAIKYAHTGVRVSVLCPQSVQTAMADQNPNSAGKAAGATISAEEAAGYVLDAVRAERFLILSHEEVREYMNRKNNDIDRWIRGMARFRERILEQAKAKLKGNA